MSQRDCATYAPTRRRGATPTTTVTLADWFKVREPIEQRIGEADQSDKAEVEIMLARWPCRAGMIRLGHCEHP